MTQEEIEKIYLKQPEIANTLKLFKSQKESKEWFRETFEPLAKGRKTITDGIEFEIMNKIISCHPCIERKIGQGYPKAYAFEYNKMICVSVTLPDGTVDDLSWIECIENVVRLQKGMKPKREIDNLAKNVRGAMRNEINDQIMEFRRNAVKDGKYVSELSGEVLDPMNTHVDHIIPFDVIAGEWIEAQGGEKNIPIVDDKGSHRGYYLADQKQAQSWREFHRNKAQLRILSHFENLSTVKKQY